MDSNNSTLVDTALALAKAGLPVFPVNEGNKQPETDGVQGYDYEGALKGGFYAATTDPDQIRKWWKANPDRLIGYVPYRGRLFGIDVDRKGKEAVKQAERDLGQTPLIEMPTRRRGGYHLLHRYEGEPRPNKNWEHGETRHAYGYLIAWRPELVLKALDRLPFAQPLPPATLDAWLKEEAKHEAEIDEGAEIWPKGWRNKMLNRHVYLAGVANDTAAAAAACAKAIKSGLSESEVKTLNERVWQEGWKHGRDKENREDHMRDALIKSARGEWFYLDSDGGGWMGYAEGLWRRSNGGPEWLAQEVTRAFSIHKRKRSSESAVVLRSRSHLIRHAPEFDTDRNLLGLPDGKVADIGAGVIRDARPDDLLTRRTEIMPAKGYAPRWQRFLEEVLPDPDIREWLVRVLGYMITGHTRERMFLFLYGRGRNGKSTLIDLLTHLLGNHYAVTCDKEMFCLTRNRPHPEALARLEGVRLAASMELETGSAWDEPLIKTLTGGGDRLTARHMYQASRDFLPQCLVVIPANEKPETRSVTPALADRIRLVDFNVRFSVAKSDKTLADTLRKEAPAILFDLLREAKAYLSEGLLPTPEAVAAASKEYLAEANPLLGWIEEVTRKEDKAVTRGVEIAKAVNRRAEAVHEKPRKEATIYRALEGMGYRKSRPQGKVCFHGITLADTPEDAEHYEQAELEQV